MKQQLSTQKRPPGLSTVLLSFLILLFGAMPMQTMAQTAHMDQGENGNWSAPTSPVTWINGAVNHVNSHYTESQSVPYRLTMRGLTPGTVVKICMGYEVVHNNHYAFDFLTNYDCLQPHNYGTHTTSETVTPAPGSPTSTKVINAPSYLNEPIAAHALASFNALPAGKKLLSIWGANFVAGDIEYHYFDGNTEITAAQALDLTRGAVKVKWIVKFTPTASDVVLAWGGHISFKQDWGYPPTMNTAIMINGASYHQSKDFWDIGDDGNLDGGFGQGDLQVDASAIGPIPVCPSEFPTPLSLCYNTTSQTNYPAGQCPAACAPATLAFNVPSLSLANTYSWSVNPSQGVNIATPTGATTNITFTNPGQYTVSVDLQYVDPNGTSGVIVTCTQLVTIEQPPTCNIEGDIDLCAGDNTTLTASGGTTYTWKDGQGTIVGTAALLALNGLAVGNHPYTVEVGNGTSCPPAVCSTTVVVRPLPTITLDPAGPFCVDNTNAIQLTYGPVPPPGTGLFNTLTGLTQTGLFTPATAGVNTNPGHGVTYTYTDGFGCTNAKTIQIIVNPLPTVSINPAGPFCIDAPKYQMSGNPTGGTFSGKGITPEGLFDPAAAGAGPHLITYTFSDANTCTNSASTTVVVNALPVVTLPPVGPLCLNDPEVQLAGTPAGGTYTGTGVSSSGLFNPATAGVSTTGWLITYTYTDANTCTNSASITIVVNGLPPCNITGLTPVCNYTANHFYTGPEGNFDYLWDISGNGTIPGAKNLREVIVTAGAPGTFTLKLWVTDKTTGCTSECTREIVVTAVCEPACTYTQGYYGNVGGLSCPGNPPLQTTQAAMLMAFANYGADMVTFGKLSANRYFNLYKADINGVTGTTKELIGANNIFKMLPGGGQAKAIDYFAASEIRYTNTASWRYIPLDTRKNTTGKIMNGLLAQTIALWFNLQNNGILDNIVLPYDVLLVAPATCGDNTPTGPPVEYALPHSVVVYLNSGGAYGNTITDLFNLANAYLGGETPGNLSPTDVAAAVDKINNAFDKCAVLMGYKQGDTYYYNQMPKMVPAPTVPIAAVVEEPVTTPLAVNTYPNPFRDVVRFEIRSATGGQGELSIYDMQGTRVSTFAVGKVPAGQVFRFEYRMPATPMQTLMYRMTVGNRQVTGKLMRSGN